MQKLTATDKCILMAVQAALQERGWIPLLDEYAGVLRLGDFILYLYQDSSDLEGKTGTKFCYSAGELADSALNTTKKAINYKMHYYLPEYHWWMECCGVLVAMGKFKKTFGAIYHGSATEKVKQQFMECMDSIHSIAALGCERAFRNRPSYSVQLKPAMRHELVPHDAGVQEDLYLRTGEDLYYLVKRLGEEDGSNTVYALIPVSLKKEDGLIKVDIIKSNKPVRTTSSGLSQLLRQGELPAFRIVEDPYEVKEMVWTNESVRSLTYHEHPLLKQFSGFGLNGSQKEILSLGLDRVYNITPFLNGNIDAATGAYLLKFISNGLDVSLITMSYSEEVMQTLFNIANGGLSLHKYVNPGYSLDRIRTIYNEFLSGFELQKERLEKEGYSEAQINFMRLVASKGKGFSHLKTGEPLPALWLRDEIAMGNHVELMTWMIPYATDDNAANIRIPWRVLPESLQEYVIQWFRSVPEVMLGGHSWDNIVLHAAKNATGICYSYKYGLMLECNYNFLAMDSNSVMLKASSFLNAANAMFINGSMFVNDSKFSQLQLAL